ncbi:MAG TPA: PolC-type DNA polymerase III, partial [Candidatus Sellimonas avistercoris]|nr:PolC-type DNA polymerase III [Candidatus Sellimonas avistercoris]
MGKDFFEVFPTLNLSEETKFLLKDVRVTKVSTNSTRDFIRIYLFSTHLLQKKKIYELEYAIKHQLFDRTMIQVEILESYQLSEQYTPENLMHEYYDSILLELEQRSAVERSMFEHADYDFEDSVLNLKLQNSIVAEGKKEAIVSLLSEVFNDRFHVPLSIKVGYQPPKKKSALEFNELQL